MSTIEELTKQATQLIERFDKLQIRGSGWSGNARDGFAFRPEPVVEAAGGGTSGIGPPPPPTPTGACCHVNGTCSIETEDWCTNEIHSDYQGDGTVCEEVDCSCTGACCHPDCSCTHTTLEHCDGDHFCGLTCTDIGTCCAEPTVMKNLGDKIASVATPIARTLGLDCIDPETGELKSESECAKRKQMLNEGRYADAFYDVFWPKPKE